MAIISYKLKRRLVHALRSHSTPHEIALGVATGVFIAIMPVYGLHTILVLLSAFIIRRINLIAIFIGTNISLPPTLPFITWAGYSIGRMMLQGGYPAMTWQNFKHFSYKDIPHLYLPLFIGRAVLGLGCGIIFYVLAYWFTKRRHAIRLARRHKFIQLRRQQVDE